MPPHDSFRLTAAERLQLVPHLDADAIERYLQRVPPEFRRDLLRMFTERRAVLTGSHPSFPGEQELLDEIYAPVWESWGEEAIERETANVMPGRELARARLRGRKKREDPNT